MFDYAGLGVVAADVIADFGRDCTVTVSSSRYDVETSRTVQQTQSYVGKCVFGNLNEKHIGIFNSLGSSRGESHLVQSGDMLVTATASCNLQTGCLLECGGEAWRVVSVMPIKPASVVVAYQAQARRE